MSRYRRQVRKNSADRTRSKRAARGRLPVAALLVAALALVGWTGGIAGADEPDGPTVDEVIDEVEHDAEDAAPATLVPVGVVIDDNGAAPGGTRVERVEVPADAVDDAVDRLEEVDEVQVASVGQPVSIASDPLRPQQYAFPRTRGNQLPSHIDGTGMTVAVIDTGVDGTHPDLQPLLPDGRQRVASGATFLYGHPQDWTATGNQDPNGHGTHAAGVVSAARGNGIGIAGLAPGAQILPVRALGQNGLGNTVDVAIGIEWAFSMGADVISLSLSGPGDDPSIRALLHAFTNDWSRGKPPPVVVAAAGNFGSTSPVMYPAAYPSTIAVGASTPADGAASFSSRGTHVNVAAPGTSIVSTWPLGRSCPDRPANGYCVLHGTSMSTPFVAAVAALMRTQEPALSPTAVRDRLESTSHDIDVLGRDRATGAGRVDVAAAVLPGSYSKVPRIHHPPSGSFASVVADGRRITARGRATDKEGRPRVRVRTTVDGRLTERYVTAGSSGNWSLAWNDAPGTHRVCVSVLDNPHGTPTGLGCRNVVVK